jgi:hypothetical protein
VFGREATSGEVFLDIANKGFAANVMDARHILHDKQSGSRLATQAHKLAIEMVVRMPRVALPSLRVALAGRSAQNNGNSSLASSNNPKDVATAQASDVRFEGGYPWMIETVCLCGVLPFLSREYDRVTGLGESSGQATRTSKKIDRHRSRLLYLPEPSKSVITERNQGALIALRRPRTAHGTAVMDEVDMKPKTNSFANRVLGNIAYLLPVENGYSAQSGKDSMDMRVDWKNLPVQRIHEDASCSLC